MPIRVRDLKDQTGTPEPRPFLYCTRCGAECSANAGDSFLLAPDYIFRCCNRVMRLVVRQTLLTEVAP